MTLPATALPSTADQDKLAKAIASRERIVAQAVDITLADGRVVGLRYGMAGVVALEETFGSLQGVGEAFQELDSGGRVFTSILGLVGAGLVHHGLTREKLLADDLLDLMRVEEYAIAAVTAFDRAFPTPEGEVVPVGEGNREARRASRGQTGSTSGRSSSAGRKKSSGT